MSSTPRTGSDTQHALTAEHIAAKLKQAGHEVPGDTFANEHGVAWFIGRTPRTLQRWREEGTGPPARQLGSWLYSLQALADWIASQPTAGIGQTTTMDDR